MDGYGGCIAVWCHIVSAGDFVKLFACINVALWESKVSHSLKEDSVVHASKGSFKVGVSRVYVFLYLVILLHHNVCGQV